jgi:hypothetical protein
MHSVLRAVLLALGSLAAVSWLNGQPAELPPIFAPHVGTSPAPTRVKAASPLLASPVSDRARSLINAAVLQQAEVFVGPAPTGSTFVESTTGMTLMTPVIVRGEALKESQVRVPELRLFHFVPQGGDKFRRVAGGATAPLYQTFFGKTEMLIELSILNMAGNGIDHNIDFTRAEIGFRFKW